MYIHLELVSNILSRWATFMLISDQSSSLEARRKGGPIQYPTMKNNGGSIKGGRYDERESVVIIVVDRGAGHHDET